MGKMGIVIVGAGWRAMFFVRVARRFPELFDLKGVLCRREEKAARLRAEGIPATASEAACLARGPDLAVIAVEKSANAAVIAHWAGLGLPVLAETPAGCSEAELLELWRLHEGGARIQIAEQYARYPLIAAGLRAVDAGLLGDPACATLSLCHNYHAFSLARRMLGMAGTFPGMRVTGRAWPFPVERTDSRAGPITDGSIRSSDRVLASVEYGNGKLALYDFDSVQYHTTIRARHINVRGPRGEWDDTVIRCSDAAHRPRTVRLQAGPIPGYEHLMRPELRQIAECWSPFVHMETAQDEYAIAVLLSGMPAFLETGREVYPLAEALEDSYASLLLGRALADPGSTVISQRMPWQG